MVEKQLTTKEYISLGLASVLRLAEPSSLDRTVKGRDMLDALAISVRDAIKVVELGKVGSMEFYQHVESAQQLCIALKRQAIEGGDNVLSAELGKLADKLSALAKNPS